MKLNKVLVVGIIGILLVCLFTFKKDNKQKEYVLKDRIEVNDSYNSIAMYKVDGGKETKIDKMPESGYVIDSDNSYCILNGQKNHDDQAKLYTNSNGEHIIGNLAPEERCFVYFNKVITSSEVLASTLNRTTCDGTPTFSTIDTEEHKGSDSKTCLYKTEDDFGDSYYFRGKVEDNWVKFGKDKSNNDIYWRIIRINGDGSIRLIYSGTGSVAKTGLRTQINSSTYSFNSQSNNGIYVGYQFVSGDEHGFGKNENQQSNALKQLKSWFEINLNDEWKDGSGRIDLNAGFCNDRSSSTSNSTTWSEEISETAGTEKFYGANLRSRNYQPTLKCSTKNNKNKDYFTYEKSIGLESIANGIITGTQSLQYPIGLITADEVKFAGGNGASNEVYWLNTGQDYWTMSPYDFRDNHAYEFCVLYEGSVSSDDVTNSPYGLRPVINLKADTQFTGDGTTNTPFTVVN